MATKTKILEPLPAVLSTYIPPEISEALKGYTKKNGMKIGYVVTAAIREYLVRRGWRIPSES